MLRKREEEGGREEEDFEQSDGDETTESIIHNIQKTQTSWPERQYAQIAVDIATLCGVFRPSGYEWDVGTNPIRMATAEDQLKLKQWKQEMSLKIQENEQQSGQTF